MSESVLPMFSSRSFIVSGLTFRSLILLSLFLCMVLESRVFINQPFISDYHWDINKWRGFLLFSLENHIPPLPIQQHMILLHAGHFLSLPFLNYILNFLNSQNEIKTPVLLEIPKDPSPSFLQLHLPFTHHLNQ